MMPNGIEKKLRELTDRLDRQMERKGEVDRATFDEFTMYYRLWHAGNRLTPNPSLRSRASGSKG